MLNILSRKPPGAASTGKLARKITLTGVERLMKPDEIIVSKTDLTGKIIYCNDTFMRFASMSEGQLLGAPHSIIRHPEMPRCIFKLLWDTLGKKQEIFAYVVNIAANGDHYWVFAHVTPSFDGSGNVVGYHSNRRPPNQRTVRDVVKPLYSRLLDIEAKQSDRKAGLQASCDVLTGFCRDRGMDYGQLIHTL